MKKILILILAVLPLISGAQYKGADKLPLIIRIDEASDYRRYEVPSENFLFITGILSDAERTKLKISVSSHNGAHQTTYTQSWIFTRLDISNISQAEIFLPQYSTIEYDGVPVIIFGYLANRGAKLGR